MVSNENKKTGSRRPYKLKARARRKEAVRRRITLAAVHLHQEVGPARTTMNAIAERAGVQRATVYNHFSTELELIDACSSHWFQENPPPDQTPWTQIQDPVRRAEIALLEMYDYYEHGQEMLGKVLRDAAVVPAMDEIRRQKWLPLLEGIADILSTGWSRSRDDVRSSRESQSAASDAMTDDREGAPDSLLRATLLVVLDFFTWQSLVDSGLSTKEAARLAAAWVEATGKIQP